MRQRAEVSYQLSAISYQLSDVRGQKTEDRRQKSEVRGQMSSVVCLLFSVFCCLFLAGCASRSQSTVLVGAGYKSGSDATQKEDYFSPSYEVKNIVIDPGHGGRDPGAISIRGLKEKDINLQVARLLKEDLRKKGFRVSLTRDKDVFLSLEERVEIAKRVDADLFISIHANSNRQRSVKGVEFYYLSPSQLDNQERAIKLVKKEKLWRAKRLSENEEAIIGDMLLTKNYSLSVDFVNSLYSTFKNLGFNTRVPKKASFYVLTGAYVPSILVEMGYLSNSYEEKVLRRKSYQKQISEAITLGVESLNKKYTKLVRR